MPRTDKSVTILTGMIIAALYVILLVSFTQESYMRRDAARLDASKLTDGSNSWDVTRDVSKRVCRAEAPLCAALFQDPGERENCATSIEAFRRAVTEPMVPFTLEGLRRAMREEP